MGADPHIAVMDTDIPEPIHILPDITDVAVGVEAKLHTMIDSFELPGARL